MLKLYWSDSFDTQICIPFAGSFSIRFSHTFRKPQVLRLNCRLPTPPRTSPPQRRLAWGLLWLNVFRSHFASRLSFQITVNDSLFTDSTELLVTVLEWWRQGSTMLDTRACRNIFLMYAVTSVSSICVIVHKEISMDIDLVLTPFVIILEWTFKIELYYRNTR